MISLRSVTTLASAVIASFAVACSEGPVQPLTQGARQPAGASFDGKVGDVGNAAKNGDIDVRVLLDKAGNALLQIRTGTFNPTTGVAVPNGYFQSIQYKIYNSSGKQVAVRNVKFSHDGVSLYSTYIDLCSSSSDDDDDDDDHSSSASSCSTKYGLNWSVSVQANLKGVGGDPKKTDVVREDGQDGYLPDIDIATQPVNIVGSNGVATPIPATGGGIPAAAPVSYSVSIPNNKTINGLANTLGATVTCLVFVDNKLQLAVPNVPIFGVYPNPNLFAYGVGGATQPIPAGSTATCNFSLSLPAGAHTIAVSALVVTPGDYDLSNNTTAKFTVTASSGPPDVGVLGGLKKLVGTTYSDLGSLALTAGATTLTTTVYQQVEQKSLTNPAAVTCKFNVDGNDVGSAVSVTPALNGVTSTGYCSLPLTLTEGSHVVKVTVSTTGDSDASNNVATTTVVVAAGPVSGTLGSALYLTNSGKVALNPGPSDVMSGTTNSYSADVTLTSLVNTPGPIPVTCSVMVDNVVLIPGVSASIGTSSVLLTWVGGNGTISVANNATVPCNFTLKMTEGGNADVPHTIKVTATTNATATPTTTTATGNVRDLVRVDISASGMFQLNGTTLAPLVTVPMGTQVSLAMLFHNPDATRSVTFNCTVTGTGTVNTGFTPIQLSNITVGPNGDASCQWSVKPITLQSLQFVVVATPVAGSPVDPNLANNTAPGVLVVKSDGKFSSFEPTGTYVRQEWFNPVNGADYPISKLTLQIAQVNQLALLVVPTGDGNLGDFTLSGQAVNGTTTFPIGTISGALRASGSEPVCGVINGAGPRSPFPTTPGLPSQFGFAAAICSQATVGPGGLPGYQQITVNYTQSIETNEMLNPILNPGSWALSPGVVDMKIKLKFTLPGGQPDSVSGIVRIPTGAVQNTFGTSPLFGTDQLHTFYDPYGTLRACIVGNPGC